MIEIWQTIVEDLEARQACGLCYSFVGAGRPDYFNNLKPEADKECCVQIGLLKFGGKDRFQNTTLGFQKEFRELSFEVVVAIQSRLDIQFYNELDRDKINESKYIKYIKPVIDCLGNNFELNCELFPNLEVAEWSWDLLLNYQDFNLDGIKIKGVFKEYLDA